jgi:hypothetical protein
MRTCASILIFVILLSLHAFGDVAPDPGFKRISSNLKLETVGDFSDYRFFVKSGADVVEVFIKPGEQTVVSPLGGGVYYSAGKLMAVPKSALERLSDSPADGKMSELKKTVYDETAQGTVELVDHLFSRTVRQADAGSFSDPLYRIERDVQTGVKALHVSGGAVTGTGTPEVSSGRRFWQSGAAAIVSGIFLLFGIATLGLLYFRKRAKAL